MTTTALSEVLADMAFNASEEGPQSTGWKLASEYWKAKIESALASAEPVAWVNSGAFAVFLNGPAFNGENFPISMRHAKFVGDIPLYTHAQPSE